MRRPRIGTAKQATEKKRGKRMTDEQRLVTAADLERIGVMRKGTAYRMAADGKLPHYLVGCRSRGIRFKVHEVLAALRQPSSSEISERGK